MKLKPRIAGLAAALVFLAGTAGAGLCAESYSLDKFWRFPIAPQGVPPEVYPDIEKSLKSADCGTCHKTQYEEWSKSAHAHSTGPGFEGQVIPPFLDEATISRCLACHAPLAEQAKKLVRGMGELVDNPMYSAQLRGEGLNCTSCHLRYNRRYGPGSMPKVEKPPHGGSEKMPDFASAEYCKPCHQYGPDEKRINGKLLEDVFDEWANSQYPKKGYTCVDCHMKKGRHDWSGLSDPEFVKSGVEISAEKNGSRIHLKVENRRTGHKFPTYPTAKMSIQAVVLDSSGKEVLTIVDKLAIAWFVSVTLEEEFYDTRIAPGESFETDFTIPPQASGNAVRVMITVDPDEFYTRYYEYLLSEQYPGMNRGKILDALEKTRGNEYILFEKKWAIN